MIDYERRVGRGDKVADIKGSRCERCGYTQLANDDEIWSAVGL
jgi:hypothetical protein